MLCCYRSKFHGVKRTEDRRQKAEGRGQRTVIRDQRAEDRGQRTGIKKVRRLEGERTEDGRQRTEDR